MTIRRAHTLVWRCLASGAPLLSFSTSGLIRSVENLLSYAQAPTTQLGTERRFSTFMISRLVEKDSSGAPLARHLQTSVCGSNCHCPLGPVDLTDAANAVWRQLRRSVLCRIWGRGGQEMSSNPSRCGGVKWHRSIGQPPPTFGGTWSWPLWP